MERSDRARDRAASAAERVTELRRRREDLAAGRPATPDDVHVAEQHAYEAHVHAQHAHQAAAQRHEESAALHERAAELLDDIGHPGTADKHRAAAIAERDAGREDLRKAQSD